MNSIQIQYKLVPIVMENNKFEELDKTYKNLGHQCPNCKSSKDVIPCVFGRPSPELASYASAGFAKLIGCSPVFNENKKLLIAYCKKCDHDIFEES